METRPRFLLFVAVAVLAALAGTGFAYLVSGKRQPGTPDTRALVLQAPRALPEFRLSGNDNRITVMFASDWAEKHPLTLFDLRQEVKTLAPIGINLRIQLRPA